MKYKFTKSALLMTTLIGTILLTQPEEAFADKAITVQPINIFQEGNPKSIPMGVTLDLLGNDGKKAKILWENQTIELESRQVLQTTKTTHLAWMLEKGAVVTVESSLFPIERFITEEQTVTIVESSEERLDDTVLIRLEDLTVGMKLQGTVRNVVDFGVFIDIGLRLGAESFYKYFKQFGLTKKTGVDLPGEAGTITHKLENVGLVELATMSFGQSFQITPIQVATMVSTAINGGIRVTPHLGVRILDEEGKQVKEFSYETDQVLSTETSETMRQLLESVVSEGGGKNAIIEGYEIGGKTATSQTLPRSAHKYISSFVEKDHIGNQQCLQLSCLIYRVFFADSLIDGNRKFLLSQSEQDKGRAWHHISAFGG